MARRFGSNESARRGCGWGGGIGGVCGFEEEFGSEPEDARHDLAWLELVVDAGPPVSALECADDLEVGGEVRFENCVGEAFDDRGDVTLAGDEEIAGGAEAAGFVDDENRCFVNGDCERELSGGGF